MEENSSRARHKSETTKKKKKKKESRWPEDDTGDPIKCSGKHCRSCTGGAIADCVAICCCPCAVLSFLALAFIKAPWMIGRKCLGLVKRKKRRKRKPERKCESDFPSVVEGNGNLRVENEEGTLEIEIGFEEEKNRLSAKSEAERVWLELYQLGHLGFGRVSFTGIQS